MGVGTETLTDGSASYPWLIEDLADFDEFANNPSYWASSVHVRLECDLDLSMAGIYTQAPIAGDTDTDPTFDGTEFASTFDGNGYVISNLTVDGVYYCGLFGKLASGSEIKNLGLEDVSIAGSKWIGGLVGWNSGSISSCYSTGTIRSGSAIGGLIGLNYGSVSSCYSTSAVTGGSYTGGLVGASYEGGSIRDCYSTGVVTGGGHVGGLVGQNRSCPISDCYTTGAVTGSRDQVGGLVGSSSSGSISISNCSSIGAVTGEDDVGGLVGWNSSSIRDCYSTGVVAGEDTVGGLMGRNSGSITNCSSTGTVTSKNGGGGLTGGNSGNISYSYSTGMVNGSGIDFGGLAGSSGGSGSSISNCYSTGEVSGSRYIGGFVGNCSSGIISNCYSTGKVKGLGDFVGGFTGTNGSNIINCYSVGLVKGSEDRFGGLSGSNYGSITNSYFYIYSGPDKGYGIALDDEQLQDKNYFIGFDFADDTSDGTEDIWTIEPGYMPRLAWQTSPGFEAPYILDTITTTLSGTGYPGDPFIIASYDDLMVFRNDSNLRIGHYSLTTDVDLSGETYTEAFILENFHGYFHGNGYKISNLTIEGSNYLSFFSNLYGSVDNLAIQDVFITSTGSAIGGLASINYGSISNCYSAGVVTGYHSIGGLVGLNSGNISSCSSATSVSGNIDVGGLVGQNNYYGSVSNCYSTGLVNGSDSWVGGLVGYNSGGITNCYSTSVVTGDYGTGGLSGRNYGGIISNCYSVGATTGDYYTGGLAGDNWYGDISNCYATGTVNGGGRLGGLIGHNREGFISNCYATGAVSGNYTVGGLAGLNYDGVIFNCYSTGKVYGSENVGGLTGFNSRGSIKNSMWDIMTSNLTLGYNLDPIHPGSVINVIGRTTAEMQTRDTFINSDWDFVGETINGTDDIWFMRDGIEYPRLVNLNRKPIANAQDIVAYAWIDGLAAVQLDGGGSTDADGDVLEYFWYNDANELIATGAEPEVVLGVGEHVITLIVNDGVEDSEPNWCVVTVVEAIEGDVRVLPRVFNLKRHSDRIIGWLTLPRGIGADDLDPYEAMILLPGDIEPAWQRVLRAGRGWNRRASVVALYDADLLRDELTANTMQEITLVVKLESGQFVYGTDKIRVIDLMPKKQQTKKFERIQSRSYSKPGR